MLLKLTTTILMGMMLTASIGVQSVFGQTDGKTSDIRYKVSDYGTGKKVSVVLKDGTKFKGKISNIETDRFTVTGKNKNDRSFAYDEVISVKSGISKSTWITLGAVAAVGVVVLVAVGSYCRNESSNSFCL